MATPRKSPAEKAAKRAAPRVLKAAPLRAPKHGNGKLRQGNPGNRGGVGRTPSALRERMRGALSTRVEIAESIADDKQATASDRLRALEFLARHGMPAIVADEGDGGPPQVLIVLRDEGPASRGAGDAEG